MLDALGKGSHKTDDRSTGRLPMDGQEPVEAQEEWEKPR